MSKVFVILGFLVSFAAGLTVGWRAMPHLAASHSTDEVKPSRSGEKNGQPRGPRDGLDDRGPTGWLTAVLKLSPEQQEQMKQIWSRAAHEGRREREERRQALKRDRDESVTQLMADSGRKADFDRIIESYTKGLTDLDEEWKAKFQQSVERTKAILTDEQRTKYEDILKRHAAGPSGTQPGPRGNGGGNDNERSPGRRTETRATSRPDRQDPPTSRD
jgi:Spy/CpxP family protein refolding chaperone